MTELLTAAQMRAIEQAAIASGEVTGMELMERAGRGVVEAILDWRPELAKTAHRAVVLCGPGNNGGDGFVVARLLKERGWEVEVFLYGDEAKLPPDASENCRRWREMGEIDMFELFFDDLPTTDVFVDALFGTGLTRPISGHLAELWAKILRWQSWGVEWVVAVDVPSGICADSGKRMVSAPADAEFAYLNDFTVTFHRSKLGHYLNVGADYCNEIVVSDIGLGTRSWRQQVDNPVQGRRLHPIADREVVRTARTDTTWLSKDGVDHKYDHGHALILSGGSGKGGAARLSARGALRVGAGLVTVGCPPAAMQENASALDAVMLAPMAGVDELIAEIAARKIKAVCIGPGFGTGERLRAFVEAVTGGPRAHPTGVVLDADALTEYRDDPETLFALLHEGCVLTPHEGEFGRLFPDLLAKLKEPASKGPAYSKVDATREAAARAGCVVLFKGADTVIADPAGRCAINSAHYERQAPWLATAGSGDVLAGFITGLLARGLAPMAAAETAAWLHVECALKFGPGLIAEDLPEQLPAVFRDLGV